VPRPGLHASPVEYQPSVCNLIFKVGAGVHVQPVGMALGHHMGPSCWWQPGVYGSLRRWRAARAPGGARREPLTLREPLTWAACVHAHTLTRGRWHDFARSLLQQLAALQPCTALAERAAPDGQPPERYVRVSSHAWSVTDKCAAGHRPWPVPPSAGGEEPRAAPATRASCRAAVALPLPRSCANKHACGVAGKPASSLRS